MASASLQKVSEPRLIKDLLYVGQVGDGVKRLAHDADLKRIVVIRSPRPQLVPFKRHQFGQQRQAGSVQSYQKDWVPTIFTFWIR